MNSEKVKEIKTGLEICQGLCNETCPYYRLRCMTDLSKDSLTLINELESENERLNKSEIGELIKEKEELAKQCVEWSELDFKKRNKIKELKDRIAELEHKCDDCAGCTQWKCDCANIKTEALEQFAERLKEKLEENSPIVGYDLEDLEFDGETIQECIDETLKEFLNK